ncbi:response regulator transcription factor [Brevifollis gellanilyticus]|uniref:DNA-binding response regulator n=1 Tax=Brevifollis gellanilyticus TaxID=748831 RepID=A0A512M970_9BACT|nr:response regulator transcription factor [Brevifollis gellanilyticus]GEP43276.1 DNA-binding response regulator [Brevifollis gellanilyticus]
MHLLLVEDDPELGRQMTSWMAEAGHRLHWVETGRAALDWMKGHSCDAAILDVGLPDIDGFSIVETLRGRGVTTPVLFLTARVGVPDRVRGLAAGGDDYLTKPFAAEELLARLDALYRRAAQSPPTRRRTGNSYLDPVRRRVTCEGEAVDLQPREWTLLEVLMNHEGRIVPKQFLLEQVWDIRFDPGTNVVDAMICRLRRKLETAGSNIHIETIRGKGYAFKKEPA